MRIAGLVLMVVALGVAYPATPRDDVRETFFGTTVADPYRWLEAVHAPRVRAWVARQDALTEATLASVPLRDTLRATTRRLFSMPSRSLPQRGGPIAVVARTDGSGRRAVLVATGAHGDRVVLDPNVGWDPAVTLADWKLAPDGTHVAYATKRAGLGLVRWHVRSLATGRDLADLVVGTPDWAPIGWSTDGRGFYYGGYASEAARAPGEPIGRGYTVRFHRLGGDQRDDRVVYALPQRPTWLPYAQESDDGRYVILGAIDGGGGNLVAVRDAHDPRGAIRTIRQLSPSVYSYVTSDGPIAYFFTNAGAPRGKLVAIDLRQPAHQWDVIPQSSRTLEDVSAAGDQFLARYLHDVRSEIIAFDRHGARLRALPTPGIGTVANVAADPSHASAYYDFSSPTTPPSVFAYDSRDGRTHLVGRQRAVFDAAQFVTEELFARSADGTRVPVFVAHRRGLRLDGSHPTMLTGYGGFGDSYRPEWWTPNEAWIAAGGTLAIACVRGGGEYGQAWHRAGMLGNKQHAFDDLAAAARLLVARGYATRKTLGLYGYSGGGLLVGVTEVQHPDLFGAVVEAAGPVDVLRGETYGSEAIWTTEVGSPTKSAREFAWLYRYAPLVAIRQGTRYPATLVMTSENDERVSPAHAYKFAATLQRAQGGDAPILLDAVRGTGHVGGGTLAAQIAPIVDADTFLLAHLRTSAAD